MAGLGILGKTAHLLFTRSTNKKCEILNQLGGQFLANLEDCHRVGCLNA